MGEFFMLQDSAKPDSAARAEADQEIARRVVEAFTGPAAGLATILAPDVIYTSPLFGRQSGRDAVIATVSRVDDSLGGLKREARDVIVDGPFVAIRYQVRGTHDREYAGIPPTGREIETRGIVIFRLHDGQVVEGWNTIDQRGRLAQMRVGHEPYPPDPAPVAGIDAACPAPSRFEMETLVREFFMRVWTATPLPHGLLADDVVFHQSLGRAVAGIEALEAINATWWTAFPDMRQRRGEILVSGDLAATWYTASGTDLGGFDGMAPTGRPVAFESHLMLRVNCGRIVEIWSAMDVDLIREQLGAGAR
jgi:steroid delta-isomerase-like uncharacterized protein